jgi:hypothetical protein
MNLLGSHFRQRPGEVVSQPPLETVLFLKQLESQEPVVDPVVLLDVELVPLVPVVVLVEVSFAVELVEVEFKLEFVGDVVFSEVVVLSLLVVCDVALKIRMAKRAV